jgi:hypothetical protein
MWLGDVSAPFLEIDQLIFIDRRQVGELELKKLIAEHQSPREAQRWINLIPFGDFLDEAVGSWSLDDPALNLFLDVYRCAWSSQMAAKYPLVDYIIEEVREQEEQEVYLRLINV